MKNTFGNYGLKLTYSEAIAAGYEFTKSEDIKNDDDLCFLYDEIPGKFHLYKVYNKVVEHGVIWQWNFVLINGTPYQMIYSLGKKWYLEPYPNIDRYEFVPEIGNWVAPY